MTMKLACVRCKRKKIKCNRGEPVCHQCITAKVECQYVERRQRPRLAQQKVAVQHLNQRLELLERQISRANDESPQSTSHSSTNQDTAREISPIPSPEVSLTTGDGQESWIYRLATDTRRNFQNQTTPVDTPTPHIDTAMLSLNEAINDLGSLKDRTKMLNVEFNLSVAESQDCIDAFIKLLSTLVVPDAFTVSLDTNLLRTLPSIINSPYINIDPGLHVLYYNALSYGIQLARGPQDPLVQAAYLKILEAVPAWLDVSTESEIDGATAALTAWAAINNHDYQLSWKFHCKSCHYLKLHGIDQLDTIPAKTLQEEDKREGSRYLYWQILATDLLFRLLLGKPPAVRWSPNKVKAPALFRPSNMHPTAFQVSTAVVWIRYNIMTAEMMDFLDDRCSSHSDELVKQRVDKFCLDLEALMLEFKMEEQMNAVDITSEMRCLIADHTMNIYAIIIGVKRFVKVPDQRPTIDTITVRAARKVVQIILDFDTDPSLPNKAKNIFEHFITFYPFCAVFSLYEYVLACTNPEDCEDDIRSLEDIGTAMAKASETRRNFIPFAKTIDALGKVSRSLQEERRKSSSTTDPTGRTFTAVQGLNLPTSFDTFQNIVASELQQFDSIALPSLPDYPINMDGEFHPFGFVRALENDLQNRNWQETWWDMSGGADERLVGISESAELPQSQIDLPIRNDT